MNINYFLVHAIDSLGGAIVETLLVNIFFCLRTSVFPDRGVVFSGDLYNWQWCFWWIHAIGMGGEARCTVLFCAFAVEFSRTGGRGGASFGGSLPLADTCKRDGRGGFWKISTIGGGVLVYACQHVGRVSVLNFFFYSFTRSTFPDRGAVFSGDLYIGGCAFSGYMPSGREGKRAAPFYFALPPLNFDGAAGEGERVSADLYPRQWRYWYMHASVSGERAF